MVTIRIASIDDAPSLLEIYGYYVANTAITFECKVPTIDDFRERIRSTLEVYPYLVAEDDGKTVGYVYANRFRPREAFDWAVKLSIYIREGYHRKGIGRILYGKIEDILRKQNVTNIYATIVEPMGDEDRYLTGESTLFHGSMGYRRVAEYHGCGNKFGRWYNLVETEKMIADKDGPPKRFIPFPELSDPLNE